MKILWIVNTIFPYPAEQLKIEKTVFGGWLNGLAGSIKANSNIELAISTVYKGKKILKFHNERITYYLIPGAPAIKHSKKIEKYAKIVVNRFKPDIIHIHGTEYAHGLSFINVCDKNIKKIISIQGLVSCIGQVYLAGIQYKDIIKNITFRDIIKRDNLFQQKNKFLKRGKIEKEIINKADYIIGRTTWDHSNVKAINPNVKYFIGNETLRKSFYNKNWNINNVNRHTVFCSQAGYPIKGCHYLIKTVSILKNKYPDIKLYIAGDNILKKGIKKSGYAKYIESLIKKYNLQENIIFTGILNEEQMLEILLRTHVFVLPSAIENSSNSLGEAMLIGMPCVASNTGGTMDILEHKKEGYLYPYTEPAMCAEYISRFFEDDKLALKLGKQAQITASSRHNSKENTKRIIQIYKEILGDK